MLKSNKTKLLLLLSLVLILCLFSTGHSLHPDDIGGEFLPWEDAGWVLHPNGWPPTFPDAINYHMGSINTTYMYDDTVHVYDGKEYLASDYTNHFNNGIALWGDVINMEETDNPMGDIRLMKDPDDPATAKCGGHEPELPYYHETNWYIKINIPKFYPSNKDKAIKKRTIAHEIGHVYGLADLGSEYKLQIMYGVKSKKKDVKPNDIWGMEICTDQHIAHNITEYNHDESGYCIEICGDCGGCTKVPNEFIQAWVPVGTVDTCQKLVDTCTDSGYSYDVDFDNIHDTFIQEWVPVGTVDTCQKLVDTCNDCGYSYDLFEYDTEHSWTDENDATCDDCGYFRGDILGIANLTNNPASDHSPCISPDGSKIVFFSDRDGNGSEIYVMNGDGSGQTRLTDNTSDDMSPSFSPDGSKIAFESYRDGNNEIYIMNADGSGQTRLTDNMESDRLPSFSPDGSKIIFRSFRDGNFEIYIMNIDGSNQENLTNNIAYDYGACFSPDGSKITFYSRRYSDDDVYIMDADGSNQLNLTDTTADDYVPRFSPDGSKIIFKSDRDGNYEIYIMNADGSNQVNLTDNPSYDSSPRFYPNGSKIAFVTSRDGNSEIYMKNVDS